MTSRTPVGRSIYPATRTHKEQGHLTEFTGDISLDILKRVLRRQIYCSSTTCSSQVVQRARPLSGHIWLLGCQRVNSWPPQRLEMSFRISLRWPIHIDKTKLSCNTLHRRSTTVPLETYHLYSFVFKVWPQKFRHMQEKLKVQFFRFIASQGIHVLQIFFL